MQFPVRGSTLLCGKFAPASVVINQGPGNLYLYRNSAVSIAAYDAIIGPGGNAQWPGGELWAATDQQGSIANVLNAGAAIDSGSVAVSGLVTVTGTVTTAPAPTPVQVALRSGTTSKITSGANSTTIAVPSGAVAGDLLTLITWSYPTYTIAGPSGWTKITAASGTVNDQILQVFIKTAVSADLGSSITVNFQDQYNNLMIAAWGGGASSITRTAAVEIAPNGASNTYDFGPTTSANNLLLSVSSLTAPSSPYFGWPSTTAPPSPQPSWTQIAQLSSGVPLNAAMAIPNWNASYSATALIRNNGSGYQSAAAFVIG